MSDAKVFLELVGGPCKGRRFDFAEQDTFTIGRARDCRCVVEGDNTFSRHHLFLEINQANVTLKDLGSLNGTLVNGRKIYDGRGQGTNPEDAKPSAPQGLRDGDRIEAGVNVMLLHIAAPAFCVDCGAEISGKDRKACEFINGAYLCLTCRKREEEQNRPDRPKAEKKPEDVRLDMKQREQAELDPRAAVEQVLQEFLRLQANRGGAPEIQGYTDLKKIGEGGFGVVYKAARQKDGGIVAVKTMLQTRKPDRRSLLVFEREKEIIGQLKHPNIVRSEAGGVWNDIHFIEMEYVDGGSIWDLMKVGNNRIRAIPLKTAAPLIIQMLEGLAYAHEATLTVTTAKGKTTQHGVIHRDLKPPNVLLARERGELVAKINDFGLGKAFGAAGCTQGSLSHAGTACGSPPYMAPEQLVNYRYVKPSTDVFSMAAMIFHMLTAQTIRPLRPGQDPFKGILEDRPRRLKECLTACPPRLGDVIDRALACEEEDRYRNGREMLGAMKKAL